MDAPAMPNDELYAEAQEIYRRREEIEARIDALPDHELRPLILALNMWSRLPQPTGELVYHLIELSMDERDLVGQLGPGWRVTTSGIAYSPLWGHKVETDA